MPTTYSRQGELNLKPRPKVRSKRPLFLGIVGLWLSLHYAPSSWWALATTQWEEPALQQSAKESQPLLLRKKTPARSPVNSHSVLARQTQSVEPGDRSSNEKHAVSTAQQPESTHPVWELDVLVSKVKAMKEISAEEAATIQGMLAALQKKGMTAIPAIRDFLRQGEDVNFAKLSGGERVGYRTLRQAVIDTLLKLGGGAALATSLEQIQQTKDPIEMAMLARGVEKQEPEVHKEEVIYAIGTALQSTEQLPTKDAPDVSPFFDLLRTYGGPQAVAVLERSVPRWGEYALIALASLSEGAGIPSVTALANTSSVSVENPVLPLQVLAQTTVDYPQARDTLVNLVRTGQIPDRAWKAIGETLEGKSLQFSSKMFDGTPLAENRAIGADGRSLMWKSYYIEWLNIRYEQDVASADWSAEQVQQQVALIDDLLKTTSSPIGKQALQQARVSLLNGIRVAMK